MEEEKNQTGSSSSSKRVVRLKKNSSQTQEPQIEHATEVVESAFNKYMGPRTTRTAIAATILTAVGAIAYFQPQHQWWAILVLFTAALVVGETLELKLIDRPPIPISFAAVMALARTLTDGGSFSWQHAFIVVFASVTISTLCYANISIVGRIKVFFARVIVYSVGLSLARIAFDQIPANSQWRYLALIGALGAMLLVHEILAWIDGYKRTYGFFAAAAHASVIAGGVLIGVGYGGTKIVTEADQIARQAQVDAGESIRTVAEAGGNGLGISALITCAIPLLVAWFAFSRYYQALLTYKQTIRALSAAPELGGIVAWGHAERVAEIAMAIADHIGLDRYDLQNIETASFMHTLGDAVIDNSPNATREEEAKAAEVTAEIVRSSGGLDRVADIIDGHVQPYRGVVDGNLIAQNDIAASVLRVANDYDNISRREESWGIRALSEMHNAPAATYNPKALEALEWVLNNTRYEHLVEPPKMPKHVEELLNS